MEKSSLSQNSNDLRNFKILNHHFNIKHELISDMIIEKEDTNGL